MAGHSHWAGIKHKKGKQDKVRSKIFAKLSREITVAAKLGAKDPTSNPRLRVAIQASREANMPKENITRAISKSEIDVNKNYENLRYEGFGPHNVALMIETLTDNKNRTASNIRTILQKNGGRLGETGSTAHYFFVCGVLHAAKDKISDEKILELSIKFLVQFFLVLKFLMFSLERNFYGLSFFHQKLILKALSPDHLKYILLF